MRVLVVSNTPFLPPSAGNRARIDALVAHLSASGHEVAMLLLPDFDVAGWDVEGMRARLAWLEIAHDERSRIARGIDRLVAPRARPSVIGVDDWCPRWFRARVRERVREWTPHVVVVEYVYLSACLEELPAGCVKVIDTHDVMHRRGAVYEELRMAPQWFRTTREDERRGLARADLVLAIQEDEAAALKALVSERPVIVVPHAVSPRPMPLDPARPGRLLLVASYNDLNVDGLQWFVEGVWPRLQASQPGVELVVCGNIAAKLGSMPPGVSTRGFVDALDAEYAAARTVVCPVRAGTGLKVKVVDALAHARPVVTTRAGAVGLETGVAGGVLVADDAEEFAAAVRVLLDDDARWRRMSENGLEQARRRFAPEVAFAPLLETLERAVGSVRAR